VQPYLEKLAARLGDGQVLDHSTTVELDGVRFLITPFEQELVLDLSDAGSAFERKHVLIRDALGLRVKLKMSLNRLNSVDSGERQVLLEEINSDVGLGCQLMHEITQEMNALTADGSIEEARDFTQYRQALVRVVTEAERAVSGRVDSGRHGLVRGYDASKLRDAASATRPMPKAARSARHHVRVWAVVAAVAAAVAIFVAVWLTFRG
jgi:hypothetical protein